ncbi:MAG: deaminase [Ruminococcus sp.]|uniref:deaminase n=1 Tax=Ruminococcus sp. TaxID=41978 RepID=UPI0039963525
MAEFIPDPAMMQRALELADEAAALEEVPVGAVIVHKPTGRIIGEGYNRRETDRSPLAHAEIMAIDQASRTLGGWRLLDSVFCM